MKATLEEGGIAPTSPLGVIFADYFHAFEAYTSSYCIDERIAALEGLITIDGVTAKEIAFAQLDIAEALRRAKKIVAANITEA